MAGGVDEVQHFLAVGASPAPGGFLQGFDCLFGRDGALPVGLGVEGYEHFVALVKVDRFQVDEDAILELGFDGDAHSATP